MGYRAPQGADTDGPDLVPNSNLNETHTRKQYQLCSGSLLSAWRRSRYNGMRVAPSWLPRCSLDNARLTDVFNLCILFTVTLCIGTVVKMNTSFALCKFAIY